MDAMRGPDLVAEQAERFAAIDGLLPAMAEPPDGETLVATLPGGDRVTGVLQVSFTDPGAPEALWSALETWQLTPLLGRHGGAGMDAVLRACRARLDRETPGEDSSCVVAWPSRDAEATRALLDHGLVPLSALGVRTDPVGEVPVRDDVTVREAGPEDIETILRLEQAEIEYSAQVGSLRLRPGTAERDTRRTLLRQRLGTGPSLLLADVGGETAGFAECGWTDVTRGTWLGTVLPEGRWGYIASTAVAPRARGVGVGRTLLAAVHDRLRRAGVRGSYLYYNPPNPLASVFWHRQGYRPLWTIWEVRPASRLR